jgi:hypothetical protein
VTPLRGGEREEDGSDARPMAKCKGCGWCDVAGRAPLGVLGCQGDDGSIVDELRGGVIRQRTGQRH